MYPRQCLTSHFWTLQQRSEFSVMNLRDRLAYNRPVFRNLQNKLETLRNDRHYEQWRSILGKLGSGVHPTVDEILSVKDLFSERPYKTGALPYTHIVSFVFDCHLFLLIFNDILFYPPETLGWFAWSQSDIYKKIQINLPGDVYTSH